MHDFSLMCISLCVGKALCLMKTSWKKIQRRTHAFLFNSVPLGKNILKNIDFNRKICVLFFSWGIKWHLKNPLCFKCGKFSSRKKPRNWVKWRTKCLCSTSTQNKLFYSPIYLNNSQLCKAIELGTHLQRMARRQ